MKTFSVGLMAGIALFLASGTPSYARDKLIGVSWANSDGARWKMEEAAIKAAIKEAGDKYVSSDAQSSASKQLADVEGLITQGVNALIVVATDASALDPAIQRALDQGIPVIAYDRLIDNKDVFYLTFDSKEVGRIEAREVLKIKPEGNYVFIKGAGADPNTDSLFSGQMEVLKEAIDSGKIRNVGEAFTGAWLPADAQKNTEQFLSANGNKLDAVIASNDGTAGGAISALSASGLAGSVAVAGQDGDEAALNRVALGTQTVTVWKDSRELAKSAAEVASMLAGGTTSAKVPNASRFKTPSGNEVDAVFLSPVPVTKDNLQVTIDAGWASKEVVCQGVKPGTVPACN